VFALAMGFVGGFLPAARAARMNIVDALESGVSLGAGDATGANGGVSGEARRARANANRRCEADNGP